MCISRIVTHYVHAQVRYILLGLDFMTDHVYGIGASRVWRKSRFCSSEGYHGVCEKLCEILHIPPAISTKATRLEMACEP
jgi:hypothetical protein